MKERQIKSCYSAVGGKSPPFCPKDQLVLLAVCAQWCFIPCGLQLFSALLKHLLSLETRPCISSEPHRLKMPLIYSLGQYQVSNISDYHSSMFNTSLSPTSLPPWCALFEHVD